MAANMTGSSGVSEAISFEELLNDFDPVQNLDSTLLRSENNDFVFVHKTKAEFIYISSKTTTESDLISHILNTRGTQITVKNSTTLENEVAKDSILTENEHPEARQVNCAVIKSTSVEVDTMKDSIWMGIRTSDARERDHQATGQLLELLLSEKFQRKMSDRRIKKKDVWVEVGKGMEDKGFIIQDADDKCYQKYRNLEKKYKDWVRSKNTTGKGSVKPPEFNRELQQLFGQKHSIFPVSLIDSSATSPTNFASRSSISATSSISSASLPMIVNDSSNSASAVLNSSMGSANVTTHTNENAPQISKSVGKPKSKSCQILEFLKDIQDNQNDNFKAATDVAQQRFQSLQTILMEQHKERTEIMKSMINVLKESNNLKRKRDCNCNCDRD